ncbi:MAG: kelch repeat-containing protein [Pseudomonadota bacterium]
MNRRDFVCASGVGFAAAATGIAVSKADGPRSGRLHVPRYAPALTAHEDAVYISGGAPIGAASTDEHTYSRVLGLVERIDPVSLRQTFAANAIFPRANHASVFVDGQLWLLGGRTHDAGKSRLVRETERIDLGSQAIWRGPDLPIPLIDLVATTAEERVYVFGGVTRPDGGSSEASAAAFVCEPPYDTWRALPAMPQALGNCSAHLVDGRVYLIGGFDREQAYAITQIFDIRAGRWSEGPPPPYPLSAHAGTQAGRHIFLFGDYQRQSSVLSLDCAAGTWRPLSLPFTPRRHVRAAKVAETIIVAGGNQNSVAPALDVLEAYRVSDLKA